MAQPVMQQRICYLETYGEEAILQMIEDGCYLDEVSSRVDPGQKVGITKSTLSLWLSGKRKRNIPWEFALEDGTTEKRLAETAEQAIARGVRYAEARVLWAEAVVDEAGRKIRDEEDGKQANLRKTQGEFAFRIAGIFDKRYQDQKVGTTVAVQVNVSGDDHLNALRRRQVKVSQVGEAEVLPVTETVTSNQLLEAVTSSQLVVTTEGINNQLDTPKSIFDTEKSIY